LSLVLLVVDLGIPGEHLVDRAIFHVIALGDAKGNTYPLQVGVYIHIPKETPTGLISA
jgi:hypothetical protein